MWNLSLSDLRQLKGSGGERFAHFVDRLIRAQAALGGLPQSEIETQLRVHIKDGGVDTQVKSAILNDQSGWFDAPTCWQFKSVDASEINDRLEEKKWNELQEEIHKSFVEELIKDGFAYRFCILGDLTPQKVKEWENILSKEASAINTEAPPARVIHGGLLLPWAEQFPGVIAWLRPLMPCVFHWETWRSNCRDTTPEYVPNSEWEQVRQQILQHSDFQRKPIRGDACFTIGGAAGVGKTRLVFETLNERPSSPSLVVYAESEQELKKVATAVANSSSQWCILVADECTINTRRFLSEHLRGHLRRIRVICLDNSGPRLSSQTWLSADELKNTNEILAANFPQVPNDRRHQYIRLSGGFVRLAADMCKRDTELAKGDMSSLLHNTEDYVRLRLNKHLPLISLLSLFHKVGFKADQQVEIESLCQIANCSLQEFREAVRVVRESPGFVVQAGRYWYVTPEIVARVLFAEGWSRWVVDDIGGFFGHLPPQFHQHVLDRAGRFGEPEVREQLAQFFRRWFNDLTADGLADPNTATLACSLVEAEPDQYLPILRSIIEDSTTDELLGIEGHADGAKWGPRRTIVWLLENIVSLPEFFSDAEACLFRLALNETEPQIGNNATAIWETLFSVYLSGTSAPFLDRIAVLRERTRAQNVEDAKLAFRGLGVALARSGSKVVGRPIVAGRLRPRDWQPATTQEEVACYLDALSLCEEHISRSITDHRHQFAFDVLANAVFFLLSKGLLRELEKIVVAKHLSEDETRRLLNEVDHYLEIKTETRSATSEHINEVQKWIDSFRPTDFDGRLRSVCARDPWDRRFASDMSTERDESNELADMILKEPSRLESHLDWLATNEAKAAERLAFALGRIDRDFACADMIFNQAIQSQSLSMLRGYIRGLVFAGYSPSHDLQKLMTDFEEAHPELAVDVLSFGGDAFDALNRIIRLVHSGKVSARYLAILAMGIGRRELTDEEVGRILPCFVAAASQGDAGSVAAGVRFLSTFLRHEHRRAKKSCLKNEDARAFAWKLVETALPFIGSQLSHDWIDVVDSVSKFDCDRGIALLARALHSENLDIAREAEERLTKLAALHADLVMESFGDALLDLNNGWRLQIGTFRELINSLPPECVLSWLRRHGIDAARAIARHLPPPYLDDSGNPVVPELLDRFLQEYDDEDAFHNFLAGSHSGESWWGDVTEQFRREADDAKKFLNHPNNRIRRWAKCEIADRQRMAEWEQQRHAERFLPS